MDTTERCTTSGFGARSNPTTPASTNAFEADAKVGGQEWQARVDSLVEMISRDEPMARVIGGKPEDGGKRVINE